MGSSTDEFVAAMMETVMDCCTGCAPEHGTLPVMAVAFAIPHCWLCETYPNVAICWFDETRTYPIPAAAMVKMTNDTMASTKPKPPSLDGCLLLDGNRYGLSGIGHTPREGVGQIGRNLALAGGNRKSLTIDRETRNR